MLVVIGIMSLLHILACPSFHLLKFHLFPLLPRVTMPLFLAETEPCVVRCYLTVCSLSSFSGIAYTPQVQPFSDALGLTSQCLGDLRFQCLHCVAASSLLRLNRELNILQEIIIGTNEMFPCKHFMILGRNFSVMLQY